MYFEQVEIENVGPIDHLLVKFPINEENGRPKPLLFVGANGSGKSILLSYLVNSLIAGKQHFYDNTEMAAGKVFKYRSPAYIRHGSNYSFGSVKIGGGLEIEELQLDRPKHRYESDLEQAPARRVFRAIGQEDTSIFTENFEQNKETASKIYKSQCCLYFPVNRYEEPAWLNQENLTERPNYTNLKNLGRFSNRTIIQGSPLSQNRDWLLDLLLDQYAFEQRVVQMGNPQVPVYAGLIGPSTSLHKEINRLLKLILRSNDESMRLGFGTRKQRRISVENGAKSVPNLFQLSTGEVQLANIVFSIMRDFDLSESTFVAASEIEGIVVVDEVDAHLHVDHQLEVLPSLIASFPKIQFVLTTHSPLFIIGMKKKFGEDGFEIIDLPSGGQLLPDQFTEVAAAYAALKETTQHRAEIEAILAASATPVVFVEGEIDVRYIRRAAELVGREGLLAKITLLDGGGYGGLDKIWRSLDNSVAKILPNKLLLLYDCDVNKPATVRDKVSRKTLPMNEGSPILAGIENFLSEQTVTRIESERPEFIDLVESRRIRVRGRELDIRTEKTINKDEKANLCAWLCEHGTADDFEGLFPVLDLLDEFGGGSG